jgi:hypothetical protein
VIRLSTTQHSLCIIFCPYLRLYTNTGDNVDVSCDGWCSVESGVACAQGFDSGKQSWWPGTFSGRNEALAEVELEVDPTPEAPDGETWSVREDHVRAGAPDEDIGYGMLQPFQVPTEIKIIPKTFQVQCSSRGLNPDLGC